ncbi:MAG: DUF1326 domain-containing protein [Candidatus Eisenbacteria bacterium]|uniref:DUF1326 domain-containing protein n=1 Tax=Eiseniibacteriota bacterium TaxID=2212470 RepID=A0A538U2J6_UNCEI|nr:MAG: DUF1326 domain-containing protein [Candidatus Eisenbacteria bacterium]
MKKGLVVTAMLSALALAVPALAADADKSKDKADSTPWAMNATIIEACSCPMFCQCYFSTKPASHASHMEGHDTEEAYCRANNVFRVNKGFYGKTKLDGAKFWAAMDLGDDFSTGTMKWAVIHFDPSVTKEQRDGIITAVNHLYPVKWQTPVSVGEDMPIEWSHTGNKAVAKLDGGKAGEVELNGDNVSHSKSGPVVISNLKYWGAPRHDGFVLMTNDVEAYRLGPNAFEYKGTNGFMITVDITSKDVAAASGGN